MKSDKLYILCNIAYENIRNSIKLYNRMDTTFMNSGNSKTSDPQRLLIGLLDKVNLKGNDK